jgi:hypothetical protein
LTSTRRAHRTGNGRSLPGIHAREQVGPGPIGLPGGGPSSS